MTEEKGKLTLSIEKDLLVEMKEKIPNISKFLEESAKAHLRSNDKPEFMIRQEIMSKQQSMIETQTEIDFLQAQLKNLTGHNQEQKEQERIAWIKMLNNYRETGYAHPILVERTLEVLKVEERTLLNTLQRVKGIMTRENFEQLRDWEYVKKEIVEGALNEPSSR